VYEPRRPTLNRSRRYSRIHPHTRTVTKTSASCLNSKLGTNRAPIEGLYVAALRPAIAVLPGAARYTLLAIASRFVLSLRRLAARCSERVKSSPSSAEGEPNHLVHEGFCDATTYITGSRLPRHWSAATKCGWCTIGAHRTVSIVAMNIPVVWRCVLHSVEPTSLLCILYTFMRLGVMAIPSSSRIQFVLNEFIHTRSRFTCITYTAGLCLARRKPHTHTGTTLHLWVIPTNFILLWAFSRTGIAWKARDSPNHVNSSW
jgi:hypothetical protein